MKGKAKYKMAIAWLLLITLMPFFVVKTFHHHEKCESAACHSDNGGSQDACNQCPICHFTLSPFTQAETFQVQVILPVFTYEPIAYVNMTSYQLIYPYNLRAPPYSASL